MFNGEPMLTLPKLSKSNRLAQTTHTNRHLLSVEFFASIFKFPGSVLVSCLAGPSPRSRRRGQAGSRRAGRGHGGEAAAPPASVRCPRSSSLRMTTARRTRARSSTRAPRSSSARRTPACQSWSTPCLRTRRRWGSSPTLKYFQTEVKYF